MSDGRVRAARTSLSRDSASLTGTTPGASLRRRGHGVSAIEPPTELDLTISVDWGANASLICGRLAEFVGVVRSFVW